MKFEGTFERLAEVVSELGKNIDSTVKKENEKQIKTKDGITLTLFSTKTVRIQGPPDIKEIFEKDFKKHIGQVPEETKKEKQKSSPNTEPKITKQEPKTAKQEVFVVYGHDTAAKEQLELILHRLNIEPYLLSNTSGEGLTIIEALEKKIGELQQESNTKFGVVLMTPDDMGYAVNKGQESISPRARQNVVLEMGMLISSVGRKNIAILVKGKLERPSDSDGILYVPFTNHVKETVPKLVARLQDSGFRLDPDKVASAAS